MLAARSFGAYGAELRGRLAATPPLAARPRLRRCEERRGFTASRLHGFTASRLHGFTAKSADQIFANAAIDGPRAQLARCTQLARTHHAARVVRRGVLACMRA